MTGGDGYQFVTLEHAFDDLTTSVPVGVYTCRRYHSPKFGYDVFVLDGVPGHTFIEIHIGNYNKDSHGCILLGMHDAGYMIDHSREAFNSFMAVQAGLDTFELEVRG